MEQRSGFTCAFIHSALMHLDVHRLHFLKFIPRVRQFGFQFFYPLVVGLNLFGLFLSSLRDLFLLCFYFGHFGLQGLNCIQQ